MLPATPQFAPCPSCAAILRYYGDRSVNAFGGVTQWSDGVCTGPMLAPPDYRCCRCPSCNAVVWTPRLAAVVFDDDRPRVRIEVVGPRRVDAIQAIRRATGDGPQQALARIAQLPIMLEVDAAIPLAAALVAAGGTATAFDRRETPCGLDATDADVVALADASLGLTDELAIRLEAWRRGNERFRGRAPWIPYAERPLYAAANLTRAVTLVPVDEPLLAVEMLRQLERYDEALARLREAGDHRLVGRFARLIVDRVPALVPLD